MSWSIPGFAASKDWSPEDFLGKTSAEVAACDPARQNPARGLAAKYAVQSGDQSRMDHADTAGNPSGRRMNSPGSTVKSSSCMWSAFPSAARTVKSSARQGMMFDITQRKQTEEGYMRLATAVEQAAEGIVITDAAGNILYVNPAFEKFPAIRDRRSLAKTRGC